MNSSVIDHGDGVCSTHWSARSCSDDSRWGRVSGASHCKATSSSARFPKLRDTLIGLILLLLSACTGAKPEILFADWQLIVEREPDGAGFAEHLQIFVAVSDADGAEDIDRILVIHEEGELFWELTSDNWVRLEHGGDEWFGAPEVRMPAGASEMPRGRYRVEVYDAAQGIAEDTFFVNLPPATLESTESIQLLLDPVPTLVSPTGAIIRAYSATGEILFQESVSAGPLGESILERLRGEPGSIFYLERALPSGLVLRIGPFESATL